MDPGSREWPGVRGQIAEDREERDLFKKGLWTRERLKKKEERKNTNWVLIAKERWGLGDELHQENLLIQQHFLLDSSTK